MSLVDGLRFVPIRSGFEDRNPQNMFAQIASAFDGCRDTETAAVTEQDRMNMEFREDVRREMTRSKS